VSPWWGQEGPVMRRAHRDDALNEVHEINVPPFIEVMLVLLIIFMVAAPLATVEIKVNLPALSAEPQQRPDEPLYLTLKSDLSLALGDESVSRERLPSTLDAAAKGDTDRPPSTCARIRPCHMVT